MPDCSTVQRGDVCISRRGAVQASTVAAGSYTALRACLTQLSSASSSSVGPTGVYASLAAGGALASAGLPGGKRRVQWPPGPVAAASSAETGAAVAAASSLWPSG